MSSKKGFIGYVPAFDGLRGIAIILVLLAHAHFQLGKNGVLGVDIFFALSGFLITTLLLEEYHVRNSVSLQAFYIRRTFRLFPALYILLLFSSLYAFFLALDSSKASIYKEIISSFFYIRNISQFVGLGSTSVLLPHTWSLAVEEQFYLVWPLVLIISLQLKSLRKFSIFLGLFIIAVFFAKVTGNISAFGVAIIHESIFLGCFAAILRWEGIMTIKVPNWLVFAFVVFLILVGVLPIEWYMKLHDSGGRSVIALVTSIIVLSVIDNPLSLVTRILSMPVLVWIGKISYSLYLWHLPIFRLFKYHSTLPPYLSFIVKFVISFLVAYLSWIIVEKWTTNYGRKLSRRIVDRNSN